MPSVSRVLRLGSFAIVFAAPRYVAAQAQQSRPYQVPGEVLSRPEIGELQRASEGGLDAGMSRDFKFRVGGYLEVPLLLGVNERAEPAEGQEAVEGQDSTVFHHPAVIPTTTWDTWLLTPTLRGGWSELSVFVGNQYVQARAGVGAWWWAPLSAPDAAANGRAIEAFVPLDAYLTFTPKSPISNTSIRWTVGKAGLEYGISPSWGPYQTTVIGSSKGVGEFVTVQHQFDPYWVRAEHGVAVRPGGPSTSLVHHVHLTAGYKSELEAGAHYYTAWTPDERDRPVDPAGRISTVGVHAMAYAGKLGDLWMGAGLVQARNSQNTSGIWVAHSETGQRLMDNYFGPASGGTGSLRLAMVEYNQFLKTILGDQDPLKDLRVSLFGMATHVGSDDAAWDDTLKLKYGANFTYAPLSWIGAGFRYDKVIPDTSDSRQSFAILAPRLVFRSSFISREQIVLQYTRFFYGKRIPEMPRADLVPRLSPSPAAPVTSLSPYDKQVFSISGSITF